MKSVWYKSGKGEISFDPAESPSTMHYRVADPGCCKGRQETDTTQNQLCGGKSARLLGWSIGIGFAVINGRTT